jgi:anion-transporting  ArsA/GET3 family ATPase
VTASNPSPGLSSLLDSRRVILCVGCGGVGKTTTTAALGLAAARRGKRVLCLTIDPAKRLSQSLGLSEMKTEAQQVDSALFARAGVEIKGSMTVMMLDTKSTFDGLIEALAPSAEKRDHILNNVLYKYISTSLAGTQEYMAMEKLYAVAAFDSAATRWFVQAFESSGKLSLSLLAKGTAAILRGIGRVTGGGFLEQIAGFLTEINSVFGSWRERADKVATALRAPGVAYVLVTTPDPLSVREVLFFAERLKSLGMRRDAFVVNRVHPSYGEVPSVDDVARAVAQAGLDLGANSAERLRTATDDERELGKEDALHLLGLEGAFDDEVAGGSLRVDVPAFPYDIYDLDRLAAIARTIAP